MALECAAKCGGDARFDFDMRCQLIAHLNDGANFFQHGLACFAHIGQGVGFRGRHRNGEFLGSSLERCLGSFAVGNQCHDRHVGVLARMLNHGGGICHLGQQMSGHKRGHFNFLEARGHQGIDPFEFVGRWHGLLDGLKPVTRANFTDQNTVGGHGVFGYG